MVDGVSVLGTAVGVTSLGIQVCQALIRYYSDFRGFDDDIAAVVTRAEGLEASLEALESIRAKIEVANSHVSKQLQRAIETCSEGLANLEKMVGKCGEVNVPVSMQEKKRFWKKKFLWPFRVETLKNLKGALDELQANVVLAVQILDLDTGQRYFDTISSSTNALIFHGNKLEHSMLKQSNVLETVQEDISRVTRGQEHGISQISLLSTQIANIEHQLTTLIARDTPPKPMGVAIQDEQQDNGELESVTIRPRRHIHKKWCACRARKDVICWKKVGNSFEINTIQETEHWPGCKFSQHGNSSYKLQAQFSRCTKLFGLCIQASITIRKMSGWTSVSPGLSMRRLVSKNSPAFAVFYHIRCKLQCQCIDRQGVFYCPCSTRDEAPTILADTLSSVRHAIQAGQASQYDALINCDTILHMALRLVLDMIRLRHIDVHLAWNFLYSFLSDGIFDRIDDNLASALAVQVLNYSLDLDKQTVDSFANVASRLFLELGPWSQHMTDSWNWPGTNRLLWQLLNHKDVTDLYEYECPLECAIHRRAKNDLIRELDVHESFSISGSHTCKQTDKCRNAYRLIFETIYWPEGLQILLSNSFLQSQIRFHDWDMATYSFFLSGLHPDVEDYDKLESLSLLAHSGWPVYPATWFVACEYSQIISITYFARLLQAMQDWKSLQPKPDETNKPDLLLDWMPDGRSWTPIYSLWTSSLDNLYHPPYLSLAVANTLWEAGFRDVDNPGAVILGIFELWNFNSWSVIYRDCNVLSTPLWIQASQNSVPDWDVMGWFVDKGARLNWVDPTTRTTPAHRIGSRFALQAQETVGKEHDLLGGTSAVRLLQKVLTMEHLDECFCHCSIEGCYAIGCTAKMLENSLLNDSTMAPGEHIVLDVIAKAIDSTRDQSKVLGFAVIRVLTFNELSLTHTCCTLSSLPPSDDHDKEIREIHDLESKDIQTLEDLMMEFETTWKEHQGTFLEYVEEIWKVCMVDLCKPESDGLSAEEIERIQGLGVILREPSEPKSLRNDPPQGEYDGPCRSIYLDSNEEPFGRLCTFGSQ